MFSPVEPNDSTDSTHGTGTEPGAAGGGVGAAVLDAASEDTVWARLAVLERETGTALMAAQVAPDAERQFDLYVLGRPVFLRWQAALDATAAGPAVVDPHLGTTTWYALAEHEGWTYHLIGVEKTAGQETLTICTATLQALLQHDVASFSCVE